MLFDAKKLDEFVRRLGEQLPDSVEGARDEIEKKLRAGVEPILEKMNLVSREEYDVQVALLERLRQKVGMLERRLADLEATEKEETSKHKANH